MDEVRIDKFLWSIRAFKTRSEATDACNGGKIRLNGGDVKPSKLVHRGDEIVVRKPPVTYTYKATELVDSFVASEGGAYSFLLTLATFLKVQA